MNSNELAFYLIAFAFLLIGGWGFWKIKSPFGFFHIAHADKNRTAIYLIISLTVANISLGTGFAYFLGAIGQTGVLFILIPISVLAGYLLLNRFLNYIPSELFEHKNLISSINDKISVATGEKSRFKLFLSLTLIATFSLVLSFEIFASSGIISAIISSKPDLFQSVKISIVILIIVLVYTTLSGLRGVVRSDIIQFVFTIAALVGTIYYLGENVSGTIALKIEQSIRATTPVKIISLINASILAIATQFYSLINMGIISHLVPQKRKALLIGGGLLTFTCMILIFGIGILNYNPAAADPFANFLISLSLQKNVILAWIIIIGFVSILFSTIDTIIITIAMFNYENFSGKDSRSSQSSKLEIANIRVNILLFFIVSMVVLGLFYYLNPSLYNLLLGLGTPIALLSPLIILAGILARKNQLFKITNKVCLVYLGMFIVTHIIYFTGLFCKSTFIQTYIGIGSVILSVVYSIYVYLKK